MRPREKSGGGGKAGNRDEEEGATSGSPATLHASFLETTAAGPSARVRPMVKGGGGGKAGDHGVEKGRRDERRFRDLSRVIPRDHGGRPECPRETDGERR